MSYSDTDKGNEAGIVLILLGIVMAIVAWIVLKPYVIYFSLYLSYYLFKAYDWVLGYIPFLMTQKEHNLMRSAIQFIPDAKPRELDGFALWRLAEIHGYMQRWLLIPFFLYTGRHALVNVQRFKFNRNKRKINNVYDLIAVQANHFAASALVEDRYLLREPLYEGVYATFALPLDFTLDHGLLWASTEGYVEPNTPVNYAKMKQLPPFTAKEKELPFPIKRKMMPHYRYVLLDVNAAFKVFSDQLGRRWTGWQDLHPLEQAIYAVFCLQANSKNNEALDLINQFAQSLRKKPIEGSLKAEQVNLKGVREILMSEANSKVMRRVAERHYHVRSVLCESFRAAKEAGRLMHGQFLWVKWFDRTLWYALCGLGGQIPYFEAAGIDSHIKFERRAGTPLAVPHVIGGVEALRQQLMQEHWIDPGHYGDEYQQQLVEDANRKLEEEEARKLNEKKNNNTGSIAQKQRSMNAARNGFKK